MGTFTGLFVLVVLGFLLCWSIFRPGTLDINEAMPELRLNAQNLISDIKSGNAEFLQAENIVEIEGVIKEINVLNDRLTVLLEGGSDESACVICDMQTSQTHALKKFQPKDTIKLKGIYKGFLKDAIFLNCVISEEKNQ